MGVRVCTADLELSLARLSSGLDTPAEDRRFEWAQERCIFSRYVHKNVWKFRPDKKRVEEEIIPLLYRTKEAVITMCLNGFSEEEKRKLVKYARNISVRIINIEENYLNDRPSDFAPDALLDKEEREIWAQVSTTKIGD